LPLKAPIPPTIPAVTVTTATTDCHHFFFVGNSRLGSFDIGNPTDFQLGLSTSATLKARLTHHLPRHRRRTQPVI
jgi:hypothetical protein